MKLLVLTLLAVSLCVTGCQKADSTATAGDIPVLKVGYVGHDHQLALYAAALAGDQLAPGSKTYLRVKRAKEVYELVDNGKVIAQLLLVKVGGGSKMPAAMERGEIQIGLGGVAAVAKFADKGRPFKIICPLQVDGDMLVMKAGSPITDWASFVAACRGDGPPLKIGYKAPSAVAKLVFVGALEHEGIAYSDKGGAEDARVLLVNMGGGKKAVPTLASGSIDGFVMNQPTVAVAKAKKIGVTIADLRTLPPTPKWANHPCCCVAAMDQTLIEHPDVVKALLKTILLATERINTDQAFAIKSAAEWTHSSVEDRSVPTVVYVGEPTEQWLAGMATWHALMQQISAFDGKYAAMNAEAFLADVCSLDLCRAAADELRTDGLLGGKCK